MHIFAVIPEPNETFFLQTVHWIWRWGLYPRKIVLFCCVFYDVQTSCLVFLVINFCCSGGSLVDVKSQEEECG